jgi:hypothetical protein
VRRILTRLGIAVALMAGLAACGSTPPTAPGNNTGGNGGSQQTPPPNNPPVITSIALQGARASEPANFSDLSEAITVTASVRDDETPLDQLQFVWSATVGTFSGSGASVTWTAPAQASTPADVTISLKVVEKFGFPGGPLAFENDTSGSATLSLHDSVKEVGDMARQFLLDFSDSNIRDASFIMRNFDPVCQGTVDETQQVTANRQKFKIFRSTIGQATVHIPFGDSFCAVPGRTQRGDACSAVPSHWESTHLADGHTQIADGTDWIAAFYRPALKVWKLCDSQFTGTCTDTTTGKQCPAEILNAMVAGSWRGQ